MQIWPFAATDGVLHAVCRDCYTSVGSNGMTHGAQHRRRCACMQNFRSLWFQLQFPDLAARRPAARRGCAYVSVVCVRSVFCVCVWWPSGLGLAASGLRIPIPPTGIRPCLLPSGPSYRLPSVADGSRRRASRNRGCIPHSKCSKTVVRQGFSSWDTDCLRRVAACWAARLKT